MSEHRLKVLGKFYRVFVCDSQPFAGRVVCRSLEDATFSERFGELRNSYLGGNRKPVKVRVSRLERL